MAACGYDREAITGVILAGGRGLRMGGRDKGLVELAGRPMVEHVLERLRPQVGTVLISANRHLERYARLGAPVITDRLDGYQGPLAGVAAALQASDTPNLLVVPCDAPYLPTDLAMRLWLVRESRAAEIAVPHDGRYRQHLFMLLLRTAAPSLTAYLASGRRSVGGWLDGRDVAVASSHGDMGAFLNINTLDQLTVPPRASVEE